jgi:drug/metabolite transporter (DMT)-like permease
MCVVKNYLVKANLLLLLTAAIWGFAFAAQRAGMAYIGPFLFNGIRFALGTVVLLPFILLRKAKRNSISQPGIPLKQGLLTGLVSVGIAYTLQGTAGGVLMLTAMMLSSTGKPGLRRNAKL